MTVRVPVSTDVFLNNKSHIASAFAIRIKDKVSRAVRQTELSFHAVFSLRTILQPDFFLGGGAGLPVPRLMPLYPLENPSRL